MNTLFRHLEKVKVKKNYYRNYKGVIVGAVEVVDTSLPEDKRVPFILYDVKLTICKDPLKEETVKFREDELKGVLF